MHEPIVKNHYPRILRLLRVTSLFAISAAGGFVYAQKLTPSEVVAKHLDSVGSTKARAAVTTRIIAGTSQVIFRTEPSGQAIGRAVLASDGEKNLLGMSFQIGRAHV